MLSVCDIKTAPNTYKTVKKVAATLMLSTARDANQHELFNCIHQVAPRGTPVQFLVPWADSRTASRSVQPFLPGSSVWATHVHGQPRRHTICVTNTPRDRHTDTQTTLRQYTCRNSPHPALSMHAKISQPHRSFDSVSLRFAKILGRFKVTALWYSVWEDPWRRVVRSQTISMRRCSRLQQCWLWIDLSTCYSISNIP